MKLVKNIINEVKKTKKQEKFWKQTWKIHLLVIITVTLKTHHWRIASRDLNTLQVHKLASIFFQTDQPNKQKK